MDLSQITPVVLTWNEAANIGRCLDGLRWATKVVVIDSGSDDETLAIISNYPNVAIHDRPFDNHVDQWNFGLECVDTPWVLSLDADYMVTERWIREVCERPTGHEVAFFTRFQYVVDGQPLRSTIYPPRAVLFRTANCCYQSDGHTQRLQINGPTSTLREKVLHDDRKSFDRWYQSQLKYAKLEVAKLNGDRSNMSWKDRLRLRIVVVPCLTLFYCLFVKGLILNGVAGVYYTLQRVFAEVLLSLLLLQAKIDKK